MGTTKSRKTRRNTSRPAAVNFLTNIPLGAATETKESLSYSIHYSDNHNSNNNDLIGYSGYHEHTLEQDGGPSDIAALSLHSSDSSSTDDGNNPTTLPMERPGYSLPPTSSFLTSGPLDHSTPQVATTRKKQPDQRRRSSSDSSHEHHKLTREDSERPIASEKIKKKSTLTGGKEHGHGGGTTIMSVFRHYTDKLRQSTSKRKNDTTSTTQLGYVQQQLANQDHHRRRAGLSYAHFLSPIGTLLDDATVETQLDGNAYDPFFLDNDTYYQTGNISSSLTSSTQNVRPADARKELNEQFRLAHPEIPSEITLTKIRSIKAHLLEIGKVVDLEVSTLAHAYAYFEKLVIKNVVSKKNRKLIAACCLFLAFKINEAKGTRCQPLLEAIDDELNEDSEEIHEHEFAVFADLEFNLYIPRREFMPHFERIFTHLENKSIATYLGGSNFYQVQQL